MGCLGLLHKLHRGAASQKTGVRGAPFFLEQSAYSRNRLAKKHRAELKKRGAEQSQTLPKSTIENTLPCLHPCFAQIYYTKINSKLRIIKNNTVSCIVYLKPGTDP
jgi:hypothetical protein